MANIKKLLPQLNILSKYFQESDNYDISSYEDEKQLVVSVNNVSEDDKLKLLNLGAFYNEDNELWFVG